MLEKEGWAGKGCQRGIREVGFISSMNYKLFTDGQRRLPQMYEALVFQSFENLKALSSPPSSRMLNQGQITRSHV